MSEKGIKTAEEELRELISEARLVLLKTKKTLKGIILTAIPIVLTFFYSYVDNRIKLTTMEDNKLPKTEAESTYAKKTDVVFLQNNIYDMNKSSFIYNPNTDEFRMELSYTRALKQFLGDVSRGLPNQQ